MPKHPLTTRVHRRDDEGETHLARQWKLLEQLSSDSNGFTSYDLAATWGVSRKTIQRDLIFFKRVGFDVVSTANENGLKSWRIRHPFDRLKNKRKQYRSIGESLAVLVEQAKTVGDSSLVADLESVQKKVMKKAK